MPDFKSQLSTFLCSVQLAEANCFQLSQKWGDWALILYETLLSSLCWQHVQPVQYHHSLHQIPFHIHVNSIIQICLNTHVPRPQMLQASLLNFLAHFLLKQHESSISLRHFPLWWFLFARSVGSDEESIPVIMCSSVDCSGDDIYPSRPPPDIASNICCRVCYGAWDWIWRSRDEMLHEERCLYFAKVSTAFRTWEDGSRSCDCGIDRDYAIERSVLYYVHSHILLHASSNLSVKFEVGKNRFPNQKDNHSTY